MAKTKNSIFFDYFARTKGLEAGNKRAKKSLGGVSTVAKNLGGVLAVTFGAREIVNFAGDSIEAASDYTESMNAVEVATGRASGKIFELGEQAAESFGLSRTELNEAAVAFAGFAKRIAPDDVANTFETIIGRATDFASVFNIDVKDAMEVFQSTLAGQSKPIRAYGKDLSAASVKAFAAANGIGEIGREMSEGEKVQARFGLLMQETEEVAGDFANTSGELANQQRILASKFADTKVELGLVLLPVMKDFVSILNDTSGAGDGLIDMLDTLITTARGAGKTLAVAADDGESWFDRLDSIREVSSDVVKGSLDLIPVVGDSLAGAFDRLETAVGLAGDKFDIINPIMADARDIVDQYGRGARDAADDVNALDDATGDLQDELNTFDAGNAIQAMRDFITGRDAQFGRVPSSGGIVGPGGIIGLAHGGTIQPGGAAIVGENGPEFISPRGGATITPMKGAGGGGGITVNVNFSGVVGDPVAVAQQIEDLLQLNGRIGGRQ